MIRNLQELYQYRPLLWALIQRELMARYRGSVLGFLWTFLNPTLHMLVYTLLFQVYMRQSLPHYAFFVFIGLLPWNWFAQSMGAATSAISDRRDLLTKVRFPAQVLPTTVVVTNLINYILSLPLMVGLGLFFDVAPSVHALAFPLVVAVQLVFTLALTYLTSAINVAFRDLQQIITNVVMLWFFATPVLYPAANIPARFRDLLVHANPMAIVVTSYQSIFFDHQWPALLPLAGLLAASLMLLWISSTVFEGRREHFAEYV